MSKLTEKARGAMMGVAEPSPDTTGEYDLEYAKVCCLISIAESLETLAKEPTGDGLK